MENIVKTTGEKFCFSYIRYSSKNQDGNSSVDRQDVAAKIAKEKGWTYRPDLNAADLGVSAYKGDNIKTINSIVAAVKAGKIPQGSVVIIETFDRFSRADVDTADDLLKSVLRSGLEIYFVRGGHHLTADRTLTDRLIALVEMSAANEYSSKLSERVTKGITKRYQDVIEGKAETFKLPGWIDRRTRQLNKKAETVKYIFTSYLDGVSSGEIMKRLNLSKTPTFKDGTFKGKLREWGSTVIYDTLQNRQVIGEHIVNGQTLKGYYPPVISEEMFLKAQAKLADNRGKHCHTVQADKTSLNNLFSGVAFCTCGSKIKVTAGKNGKYVYCRGWFTGKCTVPGVKVGQLENGFAQILKLHPEHFIVDDTANNVDENIRILNGQIAGYEKQIKVYEDDAAEMAKLGMSTFRIQVQINERETLIKETEQRRTLEQAKTFTVNASNESLNAILSKIETLETDQAFRQTVHGWILERVQNMTVNRKDKTATIELKNGNFLRIGFDGKLLEVKSFVSLFTGQPIQENQRRFIQ